MNKTIHRKIVSVNFVIIQFFFGVLGLTANLHLNRLSIKFFSERFLNICSQKELKRSN